MRRSGDFPVHVLPAAPFLASDNSAAFGAHAPSHRIDFYAIVWFSETRGEHLIDFESFPIRRNHVYLIGRHQVHSIPAERLPKARTLVFSAAVFDRIEEPWLRQLFLPFRNDGIVVPPKIVPLLTRLFDLILLECRGAADEAMLLRYLGVYLLQLYRLSIREAGDSNGVADVRVPRIFQLIQQFYKEEQRATFYASQIGLTPKRMNELLRAATGNTLSQLIYQLLLIEAKRELFHQQKSVKEIAYELGFSEQSYFARFFKKHSGSTPEAFRKSAQLQLRRSVLMFK